MADIQSHPATPEYREGWDKMFRGEVKCVYRGTHAEPLEKAGFIRDPKTGVYSKPFTYPNGCPIIEECEVQQ